MKGQSFYKHPLTKEGRTKVQWSSRKVPKDKVKVLRLEEPCRVGNVRWWVAKRKTLWDFEPSIWIALVGALQRERGLSARCRAMELGTPDFNCWLCDHDRIFSLSLNFFNWELISERVFLLFWYLVGRTQERNTQWNHIFSKSFSEFENYTGRHVGTVLSLTIYFFVPKQLIVVTL